MEASEGTYSTPLSAYQKVRVFTMGKCKIILHEADDQCGWFMSVRRNDRYPSWDELVWIRYNLIPDAAEMGLILPNLNAYINDEDTESRNVFTTQQTGWVLDPPPQLDISIIHTRHEFFPPPLSG
ncbi:MAG TPA: hypothetical protein VHO69_03390 [Phototrophicaceae bacterium]|nr:hypothetical protein [Phototrophicaceae bacterium]